jgi:hypothetical protein
MAYVGITNLGTPGQGSALAATYIYAITQALKTANWRVMAWGGGATTGGYAAYNPSGVDDTAFDSVADWTSLNAWKVMKEPSPGTREFVFLVGNVTAGSANSGIVKYSRASTFAFGSPSAIQCPTTGGGDGVVLLGNSTDALTVSNTQATPIIGGNAGTRYIQAVASDTAVNGVYGFWTWSYPAGGTNLGSTVLLQEPMAQGSTSSLDADPSAQFVMNSVNAISTLLGTTGSFWGFWDQYGTASATRYNNQQSSGYVAQNASSGALTQVFPFGAGAPVAAYGGVPLYPGLVGGSFPSKLYPKGFTTGTLFVPTTQNFLDTFNLASADPRVIIQVTPSTTIPLQAAVPWVSGVVPVL